MILEHFTALFVLIAVVLQVFAAIRARRMNGRVGYFIYSALVLMIFRRIFALLLSLTAIEISPAFSAVLRFVDAGLLPLAISVLMFVGLSRFDGAWKSARRHAQELELELESCQLSATVERANQAGISFERAARSAEKTLCRDGS